MECVYNAANTIEGQLALDLLRGQGIAARMDGEYLQGGVGELQALGIIRILVDSENVVRARAVLQDWDRRRAPQGREGRRDSRRALWVVVGVLLGAALALTLMVLNAP